VIPVNIPEITQADLDSVLKSLGDGWISGEGPVVAEFEELVSASMGRAFGIAVSNGSDALDLAFAALDLREGDEVILPSFAIVSCLAPILRAKLVPVFIDVYEDTYNLDVSYLEEAWSPRTKAILVVHTYGLAANMKEILEFAESRDIYVIEDAAEAHGLSYFDRPCGSMGNISTVSFYANKNVTTGEGGMVLTDDPRLAERVRTLRNLAFLPSRRFVHEELGWNMRLSSLQAALGVSQVKRLAESVAKRRNIASKYIEGLSTVKGLAFQARFANGHQNGYWVFGVTLRNHELYKDAIEAMAALSAAGVATRPYFYPLHKQPLLTKGYLFRNVGDLKISSYLGEHGFYLPNGLGMNEEDLMKAVAISTEVLSGNAL
jgi:perosamine synthetase